MKKFFFFFIFSFSFIICAENSPELSELSKETLSTDISNDDLENNFFKGEEDSKNNLLSEEAEETSENSTTEEFDITEEDSQTEENDQAEEDEGFYSGDIAAIKVEIPEAAKPLPADPEKIKELQKKDSDGSEFEENSTTLSYGTPSEINSVVDKIVESEDIRYNDVLYELFQKTASNDVRQKILGYFAKQKDPCLSDYAVTILDDPYDTPLAVVQECMNYVSEVGCKNAAPALVKLIEAGEEKYFTPALSALGKTGGQDEALYIAKFLEHDDLEVAQRQALMRTLGQMNAVKTFDSVVKIAQDEDENSFVRMYAAEAIGNMKKEEAIPVLVSLYETDDPNMREYCIKGLKNFPDSKKAKDTIMQSIRDEHVKVRLQAVKATKEMKMTDAIDFLIYRAKNDSENSVKKECYPAIAELDVKKGNDFLIKQITDKKVPDSAKAMASEALLKTGRDTGTKEIAVLAKECVNDAKRKSLCSSLGKLIAKYMKPDFEEVAVLYVQSKEAQVASLGLDMYKADRSETVKSAVKELAEDKKRNSSNRKRARKLLGMEEEDSVSTEKSDTEKKDVLQDKENKQEKSSEAKNAVEKPTASTVSSEQNLEDAK